MTQPPAGDGLRHRLRSHRSAVGRRSVPDLGRAAREVSRSRTPIATAARGCRSTHEGVAAVAYDTEHFTSRSVIVSDLRPERERPARADRHRAADHVGPAVPPAGPPVAAAGVRAEADRRARAVHARALQRAARRDRRARPTFDAAVDYAQHIPVRVIVKMLGFPAGGRRHLPRFIQPDHRRRRHVGRGARGASRTTASSTPTSTRASTSTSSIRSDDLTTFLLERRARRQEAAPRSRARHDGAADGRGHRHHVVGDRRVAVAPRAAPRRPQAPRRGARADGHRGGGVPARVRAGHDGAARRRRTSSSTAAR